jgi:predicted membrane protein
MNATRKMSLGYGLMCLALGGIWLFHSMDMLPWRMSDYVFSWRFLLVIIGLFIVIKNSRSLFGLLVLSGGLIGTATYFWQLPEGWETFLPPAALILVGLVLILRPNPNKPKLDTSDENVLNRATIFGSFNHKVTSMLFKGGYLTCVFGENVIDFTNSHLGKDTVTLQAITIFGNSELLIPDGWDVKLDVTSVFGATEDERFLSDTSKDKEGTIVVSGVNVFGSLKVKGI